MKPIVLGSRGSPLALAQTRQVMTDLKKAWPGRNFEIHVIKTEGDRLAELPDASAKLGKGIFTSELEAALLSGEIDLAVHSLKDLPTSSPSGLMLAAVPKRADARDALITRGPDLVPEQPQQPENWVTASGSLRRVLLGPELRYGAILATGSPRREAQLRLVRTDIRTVPVRGNIDTRLKKFRENPEWSGIVLAQAGLDRLKPDVMGLNVTAMAFSQMLPAPGQGALGVQTRMENFRRCADAPAGHSRSDLDGGGDGGAHVSRGSRRRLRRADRGPRRSYQRQHAQARGHRLADRRDRAAPGANSSGGSTRRKCWASISRWKFRDERGGSVSEAGSKGRVYLVGAGPGALDLVTLRAHALVKLADVLVYDFLCNPEMLAWASAGVEIVYAGKSGSSHTLTQDEINALLVARAQAGKTVVRLKGGDPYVFGRGGEEAQVLVRAGIPFEVVPGVTSAIAAPSYAGIPVTHRDVASTVTFVTGHEDPTKAESAVDWPQLARLRGTKIFLMGVERVREIAQRLMAEGADAATPVALVRWGTTARQEALEATLATVADAVAQKGFKAPAIIVVGEVVKLRRELNWFEALPLFGQRVVVTRTRKQASALSAKLRRLGADVLEIPTIRLTPIPLGAKERASMAALRDHFDWLVFTSPNAVDFFFAEFSRAMFDLRSLGGIKIAAVGPATAKKLDALHLRADLQPEIYTTEKLAEAFGAKVGTSKRFLLPHGNLADPFLANHLRDMGGMVEEWTLYNTEPETEDATGARARYLREGAHWITFTSASTVENWHALNLQPAEGAPQPKFGEHGAGNQCGAAQDLGYSIAAEAPSSTLDALIATITTLTIESRHMPTTDELMDEGNTALAIGELDDAAKFFSQVVEQDPQFQDGWIALCMALYKLDRYPEAIEAGNESSADRSQ